MVTDQINLLDVKPLQNAPTLALLRTLANQVLVNRLACRAEWWRMHKTVCLDDAPVERTNNGSVVLTDTPSSAPAVGTIAKGSGLYLPNQGVRVSIRWSRGTTTELLAEV
ncbi:MAG: hypothetical protein ACRYG5_09735 [Janthinobacterium lividum]